MEKMKRYAVYYAPEPGRFAKAAAGWLGWDPALGQAVAQPDLGVNLAALTADPRKYGFHGTLKPPFRLRDGVTPDDLSAAVAALAGTLAPVRLEGLQLHALDGFLALTPTGDTAALEALAARVVTDLEPWRAGLTEAEVARRRPDRLTPRQRDLLAQFGYPYVLEQFRFHLTLSSHLTQVNRDSLMPLAAAHFTPHLPQPFLVSELCLFGEDGDGFFHILHRYPLG
jgi:putative phosphonate metabolism protein